MRMRLFHFGPVGILRLTVLLAMVVLSSACARPAATTDPAGSARGAESARGSESTGVTASASAPPAVAAGCPEPGVLITAERGEAAMGYREMTLLLRNCGDKPYQLQGRPDIVVLDADHNPLEIAVVPSTHYTVAPKLATIQPGSGTMAMLSWRNTVIVSEVETVTGASLSVAPVQGAPRQTVLLSNPLDLGNTGRLEASAWF